MGTQRNYLINTTTLATAASGTTIGSGNTTSGTFAVARTMVRTGIAAAEFSSGSQTWALHYVVSAMTTPYEMRLKVQRLNSSGVMQAESGYGTVQTATGTFDDNLTADLGTWAANDQLAVVWEHRRPSGTGSKNGTIDANGSSYLDAPTSTTPLTQSASDDLHSPGQVDAVSKTTGVVKTYSDNANNFADSVTVRVDKQVTSSDNLNLWTDDLGGDLSPRWRDSISSSVSGNVRTINASDDMNHLTDGSVTLGVSYDVIANADDLNNWADAFSKTVGTGGADIPKTFSDDLKNYTDSVSVLVDNRKSLSDDLKNYTDAISLVNDNRKSVSDDLRNYADAISVVVENQKSLTDSTSASDAIQTNFGIVGLSDSLTQTDSIALQAEERVAISDGVNNFLDSFTKVLVGTDIGIVLSDDLRNYSDVITVQADSLKTITDGANNFADLVSLVVDNQKLLSDDLNNYSDSVSKIVEERKSVSDDLNSYADSVTKTVENQKGLNDNLNAYSDLFSAQTDDLVSLSDNLKNYADTISQTAENQQSISDNLNAYGESIAFFAAGFLSFSDNLKNYDETLVSDLGGTPDLTRSFSDALTQSDEITFFGTEALVIADGSNQFADAVSTPLDSFKSVSDGTNNFSDTIAIDIGIVLADANSLSDGVAVTSTGTLAANDDLNNYADSVTNQGDGQTSLNDSVALSDSLTVQSGSTLSISETVLPASDAIALGVDLYCSFSDDLNLWQVQFSRVTSGIRYPAQTINIPSESRNLTLKDEAVTFVIPFESRTVNIDE